jgi:hypothetical protein
VHVDETLSLGGALGGGGAGFGGGGGGGGGWGVVTFGGVGVEVGAGVRW